MKTFKHIMNRLLLLVLAFAWTSVVSAQGTSFPAQLEKGSPATEDGAQSYESAKSQWVNSHPAEYRGMLPNSEQVVVKKIHPVTNDVKVILPEVAGFPVLKNTGDINKDLSAYDLLKQRWAIENPKKYSQIIPQNNSHESIAEQTNIVSAPIKLPADFPTFRNTGNPEQDIATYTQAKNVWIAAHPGQIEKMIPSSGNEVLKETPEDRILMEKMKNQQR